MAVQATQHLQAALEPILGHSGFELVLCEFLAGPRVLRLTVDRLAEGEQKPATGITLDDCTQVSRLVSDVIDGEGLLDAAGRYSLEVSSPGLDRVLVKPAHFLRFVGNKIDVRLRSPLDGLGRRLGGTLLAADEQGCQVALDQDNRHLTLSYDAMEKARLIPEL